MIKLGSEENAIRFKVREIPFKLLATKFYRTQIQSKQLFILIQAKLYWCIVKTCLMSLWLMKILIQYSKTINNANFDIADAISDAAEVVFYAMGDC